METPMSSRRMTRSQASRVEDEEPNNQSVPKPKHQEREKSALSDITNGSPIIGLATGSLKTPSSRCSKKRMMICNRTPGSGETLLRGQVKTLLKKVEEEGVVSKILFEPDRLMYKRFYNSPMAVLAPTPANTPQVYNLSCTSNNGLGSFIVSPVAQNFSFTKMLNEVIAESNEEEDVITRSLFMEFSEKSQDSGSSGWSFQVNASTSEECKDVVVDELCEEMSKMSVNKADDKFTGKHTRFVYESDGEAEGELSSSTSTGSI
ncbi:uncharacterized protein LOC143605675 [Bidens hawaiensis]|uniref:uncharacterized protein LOC143605675 n=1 Tax=Bidens hawaiensis TaxID=980011 RepID=UPI0040499D28